MEKLSFVVSFLLVSMFLASIALADKVEITIPSEIVGNTGKIQDTNVTIKNNQDIRDIFLITIWPTYWSGISIYSEIGRVTIDANSETKVKLSFDVPLDVNEIILPFNFTVKSSANESLEVFAGSSLRVVRSNPAYISNIILDDYTLNPGEDVTITTSITNIAALPTDVFSLQVVVKRGEEIVKVFENSISNLQPRVTQKINNTFALDKQAIPEVYAIETSLKDKFDKIVSRFPQVVNFAVKSISDYTQEKSSQIGLLSVTTTIKVKSIGNSPTSDIAVIETIPQFAKPFFFPQVQPDKEETKAGVIAYTWTVKSLQPGQEATISYTISFVYLWVIGLIVVVVVILTFRYVYSPKVVKRYRHTGVLAPHKEIVVSVDVKNVTRHEIKEVVVRDFVPSIAQVVDRFDTLRPSVKKSAGGTELVWKIASLKPKEERVLTYRVRPIVEISGYLKLSKAYIRYLDHKKVRKGTASKSITVKAT